MITKPAVGFEIMMTSASKMQCSNICLQDYSLFSLQMSQSMQKIGLASTSSRQQL